MEPSEIAEADECHEIVGSYRRFGSDGVVYKVVKLTEDNRADILVIESGESLSYSVSKIIEDPLA